MEILVQLMLETSKKVMSLTTSIVRCRDGIGVACYRIGLRMNIPLVDVLWGFQCTSNDNEYWLRGIILRIQPMNHCYIVCYLLKSLFASFTTVQKLEYSLKPHPYQISFLLLAKFKSIFTVFCAASCEGKEYSFLPDFDDFWWLLV